MASVGTHLVDLECAILGDTVEDVWARFSSPVFGAPNEEIALVSLGFAGGASADVDAAMVLAPLPSRLEVLGARASLCSDGTIGPGGGVMFLAGEPVAFVDGNPYRGEVEDFAAAVRDGREPACDGVTGARNVEVLEAASLSARTGQRVRPERARC